MRTITLILAAVLLLVTVVLPASADGPEIADELCFMFSPDETTPPVKQCISKSERLAARLAVEEDPGLLGRACQWAWDHTLGAPDAQAQIAGCIPYCTDCGVDPDCCVCPGNDNDCGPGSCGLVETCWAGGTVATGVACMYDQPQYMCRFFGGHTESEPGDVDFCVCGFYNCA